MKKIIYSTAISFAVITAALIACTKSEKKSDNTDNLYEVSGIKFEAIDINTPLFAAVEADIKSSASVLGLNENPNYGAINSSDASTVDLGGSTQVGARISINNEVYSASSNGGWSQSSISLKSHFGKILAIKTLTNSGTNSYSLYSPAVIKVAKLGATINSLEIPRTGNLLNWNKDASNPFGAIVISYKCFTDDKIGERFSPIASGNLIVKDDGSYSIDDIIKDSKIKRIYLKFSRGCGSKVYFAGSENGVFFNVKSIDHHEYLVK
jgi:hypothetical protein